MVGNPDPFPKYLQYTYEVNEQQSPSGIGKLFRKFQIANARHAIISFISRDGFSFVQKLKRQIRLLFGRVQYY